MKGTTLTATLGAVAGTVVVVLPVFLVGGLGVFIREDLAFDEQRLGLAVASFFAVSALSSVIGGRLGGWLGAWRGLRVALLLNATLCFTLAMFARSWLGFTTLLALSGVANALGQPSANLAIANVVPVSRQGLGFGIKQTAPRVATLLSGVAVPVIGLTVGWRWGFVGAGGFATLVALLLPAGERPSAGRERFTRRGRRVSAGTESAYRPQMLMLVAAAFCGTAAATNLGIFLVETAVYRGIHPGTAGALLAIGSASGIVTRLLVGWAVDRTRITAFWVIATMMALGGVAYLLLSTADTFGTLLAATLLGFVFGWGWNGVMVYLVIQLNPRQPAEASGVAQTGIFSGSMVGPALFGYFATSFSFRTAWVVTAAFSLAAAMLILLTRSMSTSPTGVEERLEPQPPR